MQGMGFKSAHEGLLHCNQLQILAIGAQPLALHSDKAYRCEAPMPPGREIIRGGSVVISGSALPAGL